jgi:hypothetical protein
MAENSFWSKMGKGLAQGTKATGRGLTIGCVWVGKQTTKASKGTTKAFKEEWARQNNK